ncbi:MAG: hypothetical protein U9N39_07105 [Campylobacterota bacterium]|nr:hypothetical protein [Campylobacterota bacterium]
MKIILSTTLSLLLMGCATPHLVNKNKSLQVSFHDRVIAQGSGEAIYENSINLRNLTIKQKVLQMKNNSVLTYEDAVVSTGYVYNYGVNRVVGIIFPDYSYDLVDRNGNIYFFKLTSSSDVQYLILENINKKRIKMVYGVSEKLFNSIHYSLLYGTDVNNSSEYFTKEEKKKNSHYIKSKWNRKNIILDALIKKIGFKTRVGI